jgi:hypothetical protein
MGYGGVRSSRNAPRHEAAEQRYCGGWPGHAVDRLRAALSTAAFCSSESESQRWPFMTGVIGVETWPESDRQSCTSCQENALMLASGFLAAEFRPRVGRRPSVGPRPGNGCPCAWGEPLRVPPPVRCPPPIEPCAARPDRTWRTLRLAHSRQGAWLRRNRAPADTTQARAGNDRAVFDFHRRQGQKPLNRSQSYVRSKR